MFGDQPINDRLVLMGLVMISLLTIVFTEFFQTLMFGLGIGFIISAIHGAFRNPDGLFINEAEAASTGFIGRGGPKFHLHHDNMWMELRQERISLMVMYAVNSTRLGVVEVP
ncbi:hypothetical protein MKX01_020141 [Papaver californicum]|nr:hypothetical protein MKX01_020141 [Papaver californicum]